LVKNSNVSEKFAVHHQES